MSKFRQMIPWGHEHKKEVTRKGDHWDPFHSLQNEMNRLFDSFFDGSHPNWGLSPFSSRLEGFDFSETTPKVDVKESESEIEVLAEIPGVEEKDLDVVLDNQILTIKGEKKAESEEKKGNFYRMERSFGTFSRSVPLPAEVDGEKVNAQYKKGVLKVRLAKMEPSKAKGKRINISHT